ncbi:MAG: hypothetical protein Q4G07_07085 [Oscillospiraceae bacterium]|nr:hypothetical protein [Oscillospiraceae bacterium]
MIDMYQRLYTMQGAPVEKYYWQQMPAFLLLLCIVFASIVFLMLQHRFGWLAANGSKKSFIVYGVAVGIVFLLTVLGNYFPNNGMDNYSLYHTDAYFNNVYNAYYGTPYSEINFGTYGHYGILLSYILKIVGLSHFPEVMALLTGVLALCAAYCIYGLIKSPCLRILTLFATYHMASKQVHPYYQGLPHRMLFPMLIACYLVWGSKNKKTDKYFYKIILFVLLALALQWNIEAGVACVLAAAAFYILKVFSKRSFQDGRLYIESFGYCGAGVLAFLASWGLTSFWNILKGGEALSLKYYLVPLLPLDKNIDFVKGLQAIEGLQIKLQGENNAWLHVMILFLVLLLAALLKTYAMGGRGPSAHLTSAAALAVLGIGAMPFFFNRPHYGGLLIIQYTGFILLGYLAQCFLDWDKNAVGTSILRAAIKAGKWLLIILLLLLALASCLLTIQYRQNVFTEKTEENKKLQAVVQEVRENVPPNTLALGNGMAFLYSQLGWENPVQIADLPAGYLSLKTEQTAYEILKNADAPILINSITFTRIENLDVLIEEKFEYVYSFIMGQDYEFSYYVPK